MTILQFSGLIWNLLYSFLPVLCLVFLSEEVQYFRLPCIHNRQLIVFSYPSSPVTQFLHLVFNYKNEEIRLFMVSLREPRTPSVHP